MSWVAAGALAGLGLVLLPVLIHLMGRAPARVRRFPSLRFLDASRLLPSKRSKLQDPLLLLVRATILVLAVLALASPVLDKQTAASNDAAKATAAIVDTSRSIAQRATPDEVGARTGEGTSVVIETTNLPVALAGAAAWLRAQPGTREIVVFSDFQLGSLDSTDLRVLPPGTRLSFVRLRGPAPSSAQTLSSSQGGNAIVANVARAGDALEATWRRIGNDAPLRFEIVGSPAERAAAELAQRAGRTVGTRLMTAKPTRAVRIIYPAAPDRAELLRQLRPVSPVGESRILERIVVRLATDSLLAAAAREFTTDSDTSTGAVTPIYRTATGKPFLSVGLSEGGFALVAHFPADAPASAALFAAIGRAFAGGMNSDEAESRTLTDADLAAFANVPVATPLDLQPPQQPTESPATRWLWIAALLLLAAEAALRTRIARTRVPEAAAAQS
jgi:hypothetical protein